MSKRGESQDIKLSYYWLKVILAMLALARRYKFNLSRTFGRDFKKFRDLARKEEFLCSWVVNKKVVDTDLELDRISFRPFFIGRRKVSNSKVVVDEFLLGSDRCLYVWHTVYVVKFNKAYPFAIKPRVYMAVSSKIENFIYTDIELYGIKPKVFREIFEYMKYWPDRF
ncbi:MAG: hypothetical protein WCW02_00475 [Candidatus Buchananbacteria bacterium]